MKTSTTITSGIQITVAQRVAVLIFFGCVALLVQPCAATPFQWEFTSSLNDGRYSHTATLLANGEVLIAGGVDGVDVNGVSASAELYDPATGTWTFTGSLNTGRKWHTATLLSDGRVLVVGGYNPVLDDYLASAEVYDPATGTWTYTGSLINRRVNHTETLLADGRVLVAGGDVNDPFWKCELYDPGTGAWTLTGSTNYYRQGHTATLLGNGKVLVAGDPEWPSSNTTELYDPATGTWTLTGSFMGRYRHTATLLSNGKVLVAGGDAYWGQYLASAEVYDPATGTWTYTGNLNTGRDNDTATLLPNGEVLVAGGYNYSYLASAELYDPVTGGWTYTGSLNTGRCVHTAILLPDGIVVVAGGVDGGWPPLASAELYDPGIAIHVDGRGSIDNQGSEVTFNFSAKQASPRWIPGRFSFCDPTAGICTTTGRIKNLSITGNNAEFSGTARLQDQSKITFNVSVVDSREPGSSDTISITLSTGYFVSGTLISGDIRIQ